MISKIMFLEVNSLLMFTLILMLKILFHISILLNLHISILLNPWIKNKSNLISDPHDKDGQGHCETD